MEDAAGRAVVAPQGVLGVPAEGRGAAGDEADGVQGVGLGQGGQQEGEDERGGTRVSSVTEKAWMARREAARSKRRST
jgi:hypothetical protein